MDELEKKVLEYVRDNRHKDTIDVCHFIGERRLDVGYRFVQGLLDRSLIKKHYSGLQTRLEITTIGTSELLKADEEMNDGKDR
jgi:hypothetical protein